MTTATKPAAPPKPTDVVVAVREQLGARQDQLLALLGDSIPLDRFLTVALHAVNSNPDILKCDPLSIVEAIRESATLRLEPTGLLGDAYLVAYKTTAKLMPGYRGLLKLARRSGEVDGIDAQVVYESDEFDVELGTEPRIVHRPSLGERGGFKGAYAWARLRTGELVIEWMPYADIEMVRRSSRASGNGPWVTAWGEMARKSALRRLMKRLPLVTEADRALQLEAEAEQAAEPARRPSASVRAVRSRLGLAEPVTVQIDEDTTADLAPDATVVLCGDPSPLTDDAFCTLLAGHTGTHRIGDSESWPQPKPGA